nr:hypothetical protein [uncultured Enterobacter sp.]
MKSALLYSFAVKICSYEHISGFVSVNPVIDTRENISEQRVLFLYSLMQKVSNKISVEDTVSVEMIEYCLEKAVILTGSDIACNVISNDPILYVRDEKIEETLLYYFQQTLRHLQNNHIEVINPTPVATPVPSVSHDHVPAGVSYEPKVIVIPAKHKICRRKTKRGKR